MRTELLFKLCMFLSSYTPLFASLTLLHMGNKFLLILLILSFLATIIFVWRIRYVINIGRNRSTRTVVAIDPRNSDVLSYIITYLVPFSSAFQYISIYEKLSFMVLFFSMAFLYLRANLLHINPILSMMGYNMYEVTFENRTKRIIITKMSQGEFAAVQQISFCELEDSTVIIDLESN